MNKLLTILTILLAACLPDGEPRTAFDTLAPPAVVNPYVVKRVPLCTSALTPEQRAKFQDAINVINEAFPLGALEQVSPPKCPPLVPVVTIDPEFRRGGYTVPSLKQGVTITLKSTYQCTAVHELLHYLGITKHASAEAEPPNAMTDGDRANCEVGSANVALLVRAYTGKPSW